MRRTIAITMTTMIAALVVAMPTFAKTLVEPVYLPLIIAAAAATPVPTTIPRPTTEPVPEKCPAVDRANELEVLRLINVERAKSGLKALVEGASLTVAARCHAADMAAHDLLSHTGSDGSTPAQRVVAAGYSSWFAGEIAGMGASNAQDEVNVWIGSSAHKRILLSSTATQFGCGFVYDLSTKLYAAVVDFGRQ